jgi:hypothetical protein
MNSSAAFMKDTQQSSIVKKQRAELYSRIYQYAAEDFVSQADFTKFLHSLEAYHNAIERQLQTVLTVISNHTHQVVGHSLAMVTPVKGNIVWKDIPNPVFENTTLVAPNLGGNYVITGPGEDGDIIPELRRALPIPVAVATVLPPIMTVGI